MRDPEPDALRYNLQTKENDTTNPYVIKLLQSMKTANDFSNKQQAQVRGVNGEEPLRFEKRDLVLLANRRRWQKEGSKRQPPFCDPYTILEAYNNYTYKITNQGQTSAQNKCRLKEYRVGTKAGRAPITQEACRLIRRSQGSAEASLKTESQSGNQLAM